MSNTKSTNLRAQADRLLEHYPGEHAAQDSLPYVLGIQNRHDVRRSLEAEARRIESNGGET